MMRLAKVNIRRRARSKTLTSKSPHQKSQKNETSEIVGAFWFLEEELSLDKAREAARSLEAQGSTGTSFYGSAEKAYNAKRRRQATRVNGLKRNKKEVKPELGNIGRSYGLPGDDDDDDEDMSSNEDLSEILDYPHKPTSSTNGVPKQSSPHDFALPISPPTSQDTQHDSSGGDTTPTRNTFKHDDLDSTPPMPGSFLNDDDLELPTSPAFSALTESRSNLNGLFGTPSRPQYINPGIAAESRYNSHSPLPPTPMRGDMTPRQLAAFARRKQDFERVMMRSATPSVMDEPLSDYHPYSEKEIAERRRRKRDLEKWREAKEALKREAERTAGGKAANKDGRGRERDTDGDGDLEMDERPAKRSKASSIFNSILVDHDDDVNMSTTGSMFGGYGNKSTEGSQVHSPAPSESSGSDTEREAAVTKTIAKVPKTSEAIAVDLTKNTNKATKTSPFEVPTPSPSPSPPLYPQNSFSKSMSSHAPKVPSRLRNATMPSSPAGSPMKGGDTSMKDSNTDGDMFKDATKCQDILLLSPTKLINLNFPALGPQPCKMIRTEIFIAFSNA